MTPSDIDTIADALTAARAAGTFETCVDAVATPGPQDLDEVYRIQAAVAKRLGPVGGWKTGAPTLEAIPVGAPVFASNIYSSGTVIEKGTFRLLGLEVELAFRLGKDFPKRDNDYTEDEVVTGIDSMLPLIELVDSRLQDYAAAGAMWKLADNQINAGMVIGEPIPNWPSINTAEQVVELRVDGEILVDAKGWNFPGSPLNLTTRFINALAGHCGGFTAGQIITTGSMTGIDFIEPGAHSIEASMPGIGKVTVQTL